VENALRRVRITERDVLLAGLSGGADSVALIHALAQLKRRFGYQLAAAHMNHGLRGAEANRDEDFARELCRELGLNLYVERAEALSPGKSNLEERAREARYEFLHRSANSIGAKRIALAHHADDQAETVLLRLLRGSGVAGLGAMAEEGPGRLFRPLLKVKRDTIVEFLDAIGAVWVHDSTNDSPAFLRNRVRHELMPMLERDYVAGLRDRLNAFAEEIRSVDDYLASAARAEADARRQDKALNLAGFCTLPEALARGVVREFMRERLGNLRRITRAHVDQALQLCRCGGPSARLDLPGGVELRRQYEWLAIEPRRARISHEPFRIMLRFEGRTLMPGNGFAFEGSISLGRANDYAGGSVDLMEAVFDLDQLPSPLWIRNYRSGDRVAPLGMDGSRKLHNIFIDRKLPRLWRASWPIVVLDEVVLWVPGIVRGGLAAITPKTKNVLYLRAFPPSTGGPARLPENHSTC
jgi:tRNA(Ile)-lysidine synthase